MLISTHIVSEQYLSKARGGREVRRVMGEKGGGRKW